MKKTNTFIFVWALLLISCTTTKITSSWKAPHAPLKQYYKIMVVGIIREEDQSIQEKMENHLVGDLRSLGYNAYSSFAEFGPKALENLSEDQIHDKMHKSGADGVLTIVLLNMEKEKHYVSAKIVPQTKFIYNKQFGMYYSTIYLRIKSPGYYDVSTRYFWESNFYNLISKELMYTAKTQSFNPKNFESLSHEYGKLIVGDMLKNNILIKLTPTAGN